MRKLSKKSICDFILMCCGFGFAPSLAFSIVDRVHMPLETTLVTAIILTIMVAVYLVLGLRLSAFGSTLTATCWYILVFI